MTVLSPCCKSGVDVGRIPYEFGGVELAEVCGECGHEVEQPVMACDCCGEATEQFIETKLGDWCAECVSLNAELLIDREEAIA